MKPLLLTVCIVLLCLKVCSCSMFKITLYGKTMVGNNEDAWRIGSSIWFETGQQGNMGVAYVGHNDGVPQGGLNEAGLAFDGLTVYPVPRKEALNKRPLNSARDFLKAIMQHCSNVDEVVEFASLYDRSGMNNGVYLFVDTTGRYVVMEADTLITGNEQKYLQSNFCPSVVHDPSQVKLARYHRGLQYLKAPGDTSLQYCVGMMNAMHECREKIGDGTEYTNIYDLQTQTIYLYFYHDYQHVVRLNLQEELAKGNHKLVMADIFPKNAEYERFLRYQTPFNNPFLQLGLYGMWVWLAGAMLYWLVLFRRNSWGIWLAFGLNALLLYYIYFLLKNQYIYYHDAPSWLWMYIPLVLAGVVIYAGKGGRKFVFVVNGLMYGVLFILCLYWRLFF